VPVKLRKTPGGRVIHIPPYSKIQALLDLERLCRQNPTLPICLRRAKPVPPGGHPIKVMPQPPKKAPSTPVVKPNPSKLPVIGIPSGVPKLPPQKPSTPSIPRPKPQPPKRSPGGYNPTLPRRPSIQPRITPGEGGGDLKYQAANELIGNALRFHGNCGDYICIDPYMFQDYAKNYGLTPEYLASIARRYGYKGVKIGTATYTAPKPYVTKTEKQITAYVRQRTLDTAKKVANTFGAKTIIDKTNMDEYYGIKLAEKIENAPSRDSQFYNSLCAGAPSKGYAVIAYPHVVITCKDGKFYSANIVELGTSH
jgi:hypothetical protein